MEELKAHLYHDEDDNDPLQAGRVALIEVTLEQLHQLHTVTQLHIHHLWEEQSCWEHVEGQAGLFIC